MQLKNKTPGYLYLGVMNHSCRLRSSCESLHTISSLIQTILSVLESHQISCFVQVADCNRRWGITPRPEELIVP